MADAAVAARLGGVGRVGKAGPHVADRLAVLDRLAGESVALLGSLSGQLDELNRLTAPIRSRAVALTVAQRNIGATKAAVDGLLAHLDTSRRVQGVLRAGPGAGLDAFLDALTQLEAAHEALSQHTHLAAVGAALGHAQGLFNAALEATDADARATLDAAARSSGPAAAWVRARLDAPLTEDNLPSLVRPLVAPEQLAKLRRMASLLVEAGYSPAQANYSAARDKAIQQVLSELGLELPMPSALAALPPEQLERAMAGWGSSARALTLLLLSEQQLCESIWPEQLAGGLLGALAAPHLEALAAAGRDVLEARRGADKLFGLLDMGRQLGEVLPALQGLLARPRGGAAAPAALSELRSLARLLSSTAVALLSEYEEGVGRDSSRVLPLDGTVHPLTAQVTSFIKRLVSYPNAAEVLYGDDGDAISSSGGGLGGGLGRLLLCLLDNLESKARGYKAEPLAALFMMNNVHYVVVSVEGCAPAARVLGVDWLERHKDAVEDWGAKYHEITWMPLVRLLKAEPPPDVAGVKAMLKETYGSFNAAVERIYTHQSGWTIPDASLRAAVKRVIKDDLLPPYQDFLRKYADVQFSATPAKYIKYAASDVAGIIDDDLFETKAVTMGTKLSLKKEKLDAFA